MKLHRLTITNLNSLNGEHVIDFDAKLANAPLFLIHGPTGAGKTTILDAICVALWGKSPRLTSGSSGGFDDKPTELTGSRAGDPRRMLSHHTGEGGAVLEFSRVGLDGTRERFKATWKVRRAHGKPDGRFQNAENTLIRLHPDGREVPATQDEALGGLDFAQFQQLALLPQGRFAEFLDARDSERAALLARLVDVDDYQRIGAAANQRRQTAERRYTELQGRLQGTQPRSAEAREALERELNEAAASADAALAAERVLLEQARWLDRADELEADQRREDEAVATAKAAREALQDEDARLRTHRRALRAHPALDRARGASRALATTDQALAALADSIPIHEARVQAAREVRATAEAALSEATARREAAQPRLEAARAAQKTLDDATRELAQAATGLERALQSHEQLRAESENRVARRDEAAATRAAADAEAATLRARVAPWIESLAAWREATSAVERAVESLRGATDAHARAASHATDADAELKRVQAENQRLADEAAPAEAAADAARNALAEALPDDLTPETWSDTLTGRVEAAMARGQVVASAEQTLAERARAIAARDEARANARSARDAEAAARVEAAEATARAAALRPTLAEAEEEARHTNIVLSLFDHRRALVDGEACPVCGALEHPGAIPDDDRTFEEARAAEERRHEEARARVESLRSRVSDAVAEAKAAEARAAGFEKNARAADEGAAKHESELQRATDALRAAAERVGLSADDATDADAWKRVGDEAREAQQLDATLRTRLTELAKDLQRKEAARSRHAESLATVRERVVGCERARANAHEALEASARTRAEAAGVLAERWTALEPARAAAGSSDGPAPDGDALDAEAGAALVEAARDTLATLTGQAEALEHANKLCERCANTLALADQAVRDAAAAAKTAAESLDEATKAHATRRTAHETATNDRAELLAGLHDDFGSDEPDTIEGGLRTAVDEATASRTIAQTALEAAQAEHTKQLGQRDQLQSARPAQVRERDEAQAAWEVALEAAAFESAEALEAALLPEDEATRIERTVQGADEALRDATTRAGKVGDDRQSHAATLPEALRARREAAEAEGTDEAELRRALGLECEEATAAARSASEQVGSLRRQVAEDDDAIRRAAELRGELDEALAEHTLWTRIHNLIGTNNGGAFRDLAMAWAFRDIVLRASRRLKSILPRYQLRSVEDERGLPVMDVCVLDGYASDQRRPLTTLSGGEKFCVSLAMALALSESRHSGVRMETLLLDEGFGTLDGESLRLVLQALHAVQEESKAQLGIISHVAGLVERIEYRIHVKRVGGNRSSVEVVGG